MQEAQPVVAHLAADELLGPEPLAVFVEPTKLEFRASVASILVFVQTAQPDYGEPSEKGNADDTANEALPGNGFFHIRIFFVNVFGLCFVAEEFVV